MTFWGVVVKPGESYTHKFDKKRPHFTVLLATLGEEVVNVGERTVLKCSVGNNESISLCNLLRGKSETLNLNVEFEEEDITFSVHGPCSVHLTGNLKGSGSKKSKYSKKSIHKGRRHVTLNVKNAPNLDEDLISEESRALSTDSPESQKSETPGKDKKKSRKRKRT